MNFNKYNAKKTQIDGIVFDSQAEADFYEELKLYQEMKLLKIIKLQPKVYLTDAKILYKPDFLIEENGKMVYIDVKGMETQGFKIKKRLWKHYGPGILRILKRKGKSFYVSETI